MKYLITLFITLTIFSNLQAKEVAIGNTDIKDTELCEIFTDKVHAYADANDGKASSIKTLQYFKTRQQAHCK